MKDKKSTKAFFKSLKDREAEEFSSSAKALDKTGWHPKRKEKNAVLYYML